MWGVIAGEDFQCAIGEPINDCGAIISRAKRGIHFEVRVVRRPFRALSLGLQFAAVFSPEMFAAADRGIGKSEVVDTGLARDWHSASFGLSDQFH